MKKKREIGRILTNNSHFLVAAFDVYLLRVILVCWYELLYDT
jgi:hypothetical protein